MTDPVTTAETLIDLLVGALTSSTAAGADVEAFRDWDINTNSGPFTPKITIDLPKEDKESLGNAGPASFNTTARIMLHGFVSAIAASEPGGDGGEIRVRQAALQLRRQIEVAVINDPDLMGSISEIVAVRTEFQASTGNNGLHIIEVGMEFALRFYQGPEDFAPLEADEVDDMHIDVKPAGLPGVDLPLDISLT